MSAALQTKIADQIASVLLHTAEGNLAGAKAEAADRSGKPDAADQLEDTATRHHTIAGRAQEIVDTITETAALCGSPIESDTITAATREAREQQSGIPGEAIGSTVDRIEDETRSIRRSLRRK